MFGWKQSDTESPDAAVAASNGNSTSIETPVLKPVEWRSPTFRQVDRPDCTETFADTISGVFFDGQTLRVEFSVSRMDEPKAGAPLTGYRSPACRLVLPPAAALDLVQKMQQVGSALAKAGFVKSSATGSNKVN
jgi:hypothetical protein